MALTQRFRIASNSLLGLTRGSASFRSRMGWSTTADGAASAQGGGTSLSSSSARRELSSAAAVDSSNAEDGASDPKPRPTSNARGKAIAKSKAEAQGVPFGAAYPGAPADLMTRLGFASNKANADHYPTLFDPTTCQRSGRLTIKPHKGSLHRDPFGIWYEQHGTGPVKILFVMGLQSSCFSWLDSVVKYGKDPRYSCVVLDNRGFANSDAPYGRYRTSCMAWDCLLLLDELGWTAQREVHVVGVSMGGMITLELAKIAPERFASIMLVSTTSGQGGGEKSFLTSLPPARGVATMGKLMGGGGLVMGDSARARAVVEMLFPSKWLAEKHEGHPEGRTNREVMQDIVQWRSSFARQAPFHGSASQIGAVLTHRVTNKELAAISENIPKITIMTGDEDNLVNPLNSEHLAENIPRAKLIRLEDTGHAITIQRPEEIHKALDEDILSAQELIKNGDWIKSDNELKEAKAERERQDAAAAQKEAQNEKELRQAEGLGATEDELDILNRAADVFEKDIAPGASQ